MFPQQLRDSIYNPDFYSSVAGSTLGRALAYYYKLVLCLAVFVTAVVGVAARPHYQAFIAKVDTVLTQHYPAGLELTLKDGQLSTNQSGPVIIPMPALVEERGMGPLGQVNHLPDLQNLLVIDTAQPFSLQEFADYRTGALLTADHLVNYRREGSEITVQVHDLRNMPNFALTPAKVAELSARLTHFAAGWLGALLLLGLFALVFFLATLMLVYLFLGAVLVYLVLRLQGHHFTYGQAYRISLHAITLPLLVKATIALPFIPFVLPKFVFTALLLAVVVMNFHRAAKTSTVTLQEGV